MPLLLPLLLLRLRLLLSCYCYSYSYSYSYYYYYYHYYDCDRDCGCVYSTNRRHFHHDDHFYDDFSGYGAATLPMTASDSFMNSTISTDAQ